MSFSADPADRSKKPGHFQSGGDRYRMFRPQYPDTLVQTLAKLAPTPELALDVGCGNGQLTTMLAPYFQQVIGVDPSESQLTHAATADNVMYRQQTAEDIRLANRSVDLVVVAQAAHWFDLDTFYRRVRSMAKQGAVIALLSYGVPRLPDPVNAIFKHGYWEDVHHFWPPERVHVETGYADLYFPFPHLSFPQQSCRRAMTVADFIGYMTTWSAYKKASKTNNLEPFERLFQGLKKVWSDAEKKEVIWPISVRAGRVTD